MTDIYLRLRNEEKAAQLLAILSSLDFVEILRSTSTEESQKEGLAKAFQAMQTHPPFQEIKDPTAWQRTQRDEWE